jgi:hypothetical protein
LEIKEQTSTLENAERIGLIDIIGHDPKSDAAVLVMKETHPWNGSEAQLHRLQERFNTYASFLLDGEFAESHPDLAKKPARIEVHCTNMPDQRSIELISLIHDQLAFQDIKLEVVIREEKDCGRGCGCH